MSDSDQEGLEEMIAAAVDVVCRECPERVPDLARDVPSAFKFLVSKWAIASYLHLHWPQVLRAVPDSGMFSAFLAAFRNMAWAALWEELPRRLPRARSRTQTRVLLLYLATIRFLPHQDPDGRRFQELVDSVSERNIGALRSAANRLADAIPLESASELRSCLRNFYFERLHQ